MGKVAFVFPGQGSQYVGMGKELCDSFPSAREIFAQADEAVGFPLSDLCFRGPEKDLKITANTQPTILTVSVATTRILQERGFLPHYVAGHSLGEYSALVCAGCLTFRDAVRAVRSRGLYMQEAVPVGNGSMAAVLGLGADLVRDACEEAAGEGLVSPANYNSPLQTVIAGDIAAVRKAGEYARAKGAKGVIPLSVSAPFHCALMAPARDRLAADLQRLAFGSLGVPLITNADAAEIRNGEAAREALIRQVCAPVRWVESIRYLTSRGVDRFVEVGPGKVLSGLVKKIAPEVQTFSVDGARSVEALASAFSDATM